jgi:hypothetical protein
VYNTVGVQHSEVRTVFQRSCFIESESPVQEDSLLIILQRIRRMANTPDDPLFHFTTCLDRVLGRSTTWITSVEVFQMPDAESSSVLSPNITPKPGSAEQHLHLGRG